MRHPLTERILDTVSSEERMAELQRLARDDVHEALARVFSDGPKKKFKLSNTLIKQRITPIFKLLSRARQVKDEKKRAAIAEVLAEHLTNFGPLVGTIGAIGSIVAKQEDQAQSDDDDPCGPIQTELDALGDRARDLWEMYFNCRMGAGGEGETEDEGAFFFIGGIDIPEIGTSDVDWEEDELAPIPVDEEDCAEIWAQLSAVSAEWTRLAGELSICRAANS